MGQRVSIQRISITAFDLYLNKYQCIKRGDLCTLPVLFSTIKWTHLWYCFLWSVMGPSLRADSTKIRSCQLSWWRHQMETFSALLTLCEGNSPVDSLHESHCTHYVAILILYNSRDSYVSLACMYLQHIFIYQYFRFLKMYVVLRFRNGK